jgi:elongation factor 1-alpha
MEMKVKKLKANVVLLGDEGSGKSTIAGHLLQLLNKEAQLCDRYEKKTAESGTPDAKFAWVVDKIPKERELGHTINVSYHCLETETASFTLFNVPGRRKYAGNMIAGTSCADIAVLVVSAQRGEFEAGMGRFGQTKEQATIAFSMGVKQLIVGINKIDTCNTLWAQDRYEEIKTELSSFLGHFVRKFQEICYIPLSGWWGSNLMERSTSLHWYSGPTLLQAMTAVLPIDRPIDQPLRFSILNIYEIAGIGTVVLGNVNTGSLSPGSTYTLFPGKLPITACVLERHYEPLERAEAGDFIEISLKSSSIPHQNMQKGFVISDINYTPQEFTCFTALLLVLFHPSHIRPGYRATLYCHTANSPCIVEALKTKIDRRTGKAVEASPASVKTGEMMMCTLRLEKAIYMEICEKYRQMARFILREMGVTVAVGEIKVVGTEQS